MKKKYRVILPFEIDGHKYEHGDTVELDSDTADVYAFALIAIEGE
jgi:hypothetical protein